jgi:molecular chaperone DnaK (HSP70)
MIKYLHYRVVQGEAGGPAVAVETNGRRYKYTPEEIAGRIMAKLRDTAEERTGEEVGYAVVAVPSSSSDYYRQAVKDAGTTVDLKVLRVVNEYAAAGMAYGLHLTEQDEPKFIVLDLGASKTDATIVSVDQGVMEPLAMVSEPTVDRIANRRLVN